MNEVLARRAGWVSARIREIGARPGGRLAENSSILEFVRAVDSHLGIRSQVDCASTDANIPLSMGLPAISIGAGGQGGGAHTTSEWYHPDGREVGLRRILLTRVTPQRVINRAEIALALVALVWGATFVLVKNALADISTVCFSSACDSARPLILAALYRARGGGFMGQGLGAGILVGSLLFTGYLAEDVRSEIHQSRNIRLYHRL